MSDQARKALIDLIKETIPGAKTGTVKSVDEGEHTCVITPFDDGSDYQDVRLRAVIDANDDGMVNIPEVNSEVLIAPMYNNSDVYYVAVFTKVSKWTLKVVGGAKIEIDNQGKIKVNGGQLGGVPKVGTVKTKLNTLEGEVNKLKAVLAAIIVAAAGPGAATPVTNGTLAAFFATGGFLAAPPITPSTELELANNNFKQ